jgi:apolipoprotein N-acyltransferase
MLDGSRRRKGIETEGANLVVWPEAKVPPDRIIHPDNVQVLA